MAHKWNSEHQPGTPDSPDEWFTTCENCGAELTDDNRHSPCPEDEDRPRPGVVRVPIERR